MDNKKILSDNLFELLPYDVTIKDFAKMCDIPYTTVLNYFNLKGEPTATNLAKMAKVLGCQIEDLVRGFDLGEAGKQSGSNDE